MLRSRSASLRKSSGSLAASSAAKTAERLGTSERMRLPLSGSRRMETSEERKRNSTGIVTCWLLPLMKTRALEVLGIIPPFCYLS